MPVSIVCECVSRKVALLKITAAQSVRRATLLTKDVAVRLYRALRLFHVVDCWLCATFFGWCVIGWLMCCRRVAVALVDGALPRRACVWARVCVCAGAGRADGRKYVRPLRPELEAAGSQLRAQSFFS